MQIFIFLSEIILGLFLWDKITIIIDSGNGLVQSGNEPLYKPSLT